jgi:SAM-dependent methyltransferase
MNPKAMEPHGRALAAWFMGDTGAELVILRDDGDRAAIPVGYFFREEAEFGAIERAALDHCVGKVLDVGAGTGLHALALREKGLPVTAIDISVDAVDIMKRRGLKDVHLADVFEYNGGPFDTIMLMGHGIGMAETIAGLDRFLSHARRLVSPGGQLLLDSLDVRVTGEERHLAYHESNRKAGRYVGETRLRFGFRDEEGPECGWLHVDKETLGEHAGKAGFCSEVLLEQKDGQYLARLTVKDAAGGA